MTKDLIEELISTFEYHPDGFLIRKSTGRPSGQRANTPNGYALVGVGGRMLFAHRIIYAIIHGKIPNGDIDHIDQNPMNNRIENLRDVSHSDNQHNSKKRKDNSSGFPGVCWHARYQKWQAEIKVNSRPIFLGRFDDYDDAIRARKMAKIKYHPTSPEAIKYASEFAANSTVHGGADE